MAMLREGRWGNNQAPEAGVGACDPPVLEMPPEHDHNRSERRETARGKMAAPLAAPANSWGRESRSLSFSERRTPGLAAVRMDD